MKTISRNAMASGKKELKSGSSPLKYFKMGSRGKPMSSAICSYSFFKPTLGFIVSSHVNTMWSSRRPARWNEK